MIDYVSLSALAAVVREGSFERAARALNVTPSAVSQRIRSLEDRVGCALVERVQPCIPTETGRRLCLHLDQVRILEQELQSEMPSMATSGISRVPLPVAVNADSLATWIAPVLAKFGVDEPVLMEVVVDDESFTADWLRKGRVLAAVTGVAKPAAGCDTIALGSMRYVAAASPNFVNHYFADGVTAKSLASAPSLAFNNKDSLQEVWARHFCRRRIELTRHMFPSAEAFLVGAKAGMGWGMHPEHLVKPFLDDGSLVQLAPNLPLDVPLYWHHARAASKLTERLTKQVVNGAKRALYPA
jgi:LysR family transcriptional regulator (chromosome initiation inhibitor)